MDLSKSAGKRSGHTTFKRDHHTRNSPRQAGTRGKRRGCYHDAGGESFLIGHLLSGISVVVVGWVLTQRIVVEDDGSSGSRAAGSRSRLRRGIDRCVATFDRESVRFSSSRSSLTIGVKSSRPIWGGARYEPQSELYEQNIRFGSRPSSCCPITSTRCGSYRPAIRTIPLAGV